jgi:preprotein translocase subunit SecG
MNLMLVVFCVVLIGFVLLNRKMSESLNQKQAHTEQPARTND